MKYKTIKYSTTICTFTVHDATSRTSEYLSQQLNARQNEPPLNILQTPNLGTVVQMAAAHESTCNKNIAKKHTNTCCKKQYAEDATCKKATH